MFKPIQCMCLWGRARTIPSISQIPYSVVTYYSYPCQFVSRIREPSLAIWSSDLILRLSEFRIFSKFVYTYICSNINISIYCLVAVCIIGPFSSSTAPICNLISVAVVIGTEIRLILLPSSLVIIMPPKSRTVRSDSPSQPTVVLLVPLRTVLLSFQARPSQQPSSCP
jgi:hypothetical protein